MALISEGGDGSTAPATGVASTAVPASSGRGGGPAAGNAKKAAFSGFAFAILFTLGLVLVNRIPRLDSPDSTYTAFYTTGSGGVLVTVGLYLVPFAGIAYLWFMMAFRALLDRPADLTQGLQLASGVAFVCMLFAGTAAAGAVALMLHFARVPAPPVSVDRVLSSVGYGLVFVYGVRVAGMFTITTTTLARRAGLMPRWLAVLSYLLAAFLLLTTTTQPATLLAYPAWVLLVSLALLRSSRTRPRAALAARGLRARQVAPKHTSGGDPMTTSPSTRRSAAAGAAAGHRQRPGRQPEARGRERDQAGPGVRADLPAEGAGRAPVHRLGKRSGRGAVRRAAVRQAGHRRAFRGTPGSGEHRPVHLRHRRPAVAARAQHLAAELQPAGDAGLPPDDAGRGRSADAEVGAAQQRRRDRRRG